MTASVGLYTIQLATIIGLNVVTTCSAKHADLVRSYGAKHVFDYKDPQVAKKIKQAAPDLKYVFDTIGQSASSTTASNTLAGNGSLCTVRPGKANTENVASGTKVTDVLVWTAFLKDHAYGEFKWPVCSPTLLPLHFHKGKLEFHIKTNIIQASKADHELCTELFEKVPEWLGKGVVKPSNPMVLSGLDKVGKGFQEYRDGKISAYKIVYEV